MAGFSFPVSFKEFIKDPVKAILFLAIIAIMYLYIDNKMVYKEQIQTQAVRIVKLETQVGELQDKLLSLQDKLIELSMHVTEHVDDNG